MTNIHITKVTFYKQLQLLPKLPKKHSKLGLYTKTAELKVDCHFFQMCKLELLCDYGKAKYTL